MNGIRTDPQYSHLPPGGNSAIIPEPSPLEVTVEQSITAPTEPGYYLDIPSHVYHSGPGVSKSQLDLLNKSPALLQWSKDAPRDDEARPAVEIGDAFHAIALEPHRFDAEYIGDFVPPEDAITTVDQLKAALDLEGVGYTTKDTRPSLAAKLLAFNPEAPVLDELRARWQQQVGDRYVLTSAEDKKVRLMLGSARAHPTARFFLDAPGDVEPSIYWTDRQTGVLCRCRPDKIARLPNGKVFLVDVKTTGDMDRFSNSVEDYRYHVQAAGYTEGYTEHFGTPPDGFIFLVVSTQRDAGRYPVRCFTMLSDDFIAGQAAFRANLDTYAACTAKGVWPGVETISRPEWARRRDAA